MFKLVRWTKLLISPPKTLLAALLPTPKVFKCLRWIRDKDSNYFGQICSFFISLGKANIDHVAHRKVQLSTLLRKVDSPMRGAIGTIGHFFPSDSSAGLDS